MPEPRPERVEVRCDPERSHPLSRHLDGSDHDESTGTEGVIALDTVRYDGKFLHPAPTSILTRSKKGYTPIGGPAVFTVRETASPTSKVVARVP